MSVLEERTTGSSSLGPVDTGGSNDNKDTCRIANAGIKKEEEEEKKERMKKEMQLPMFPEPIADNGGISSEDFLAAAKRVVSMLDYFGKLFMPVKYDMQGNINKLTKKMNLDRNNHDTLQKMLMAEREKMETPIAADALMWLRRGLHMIQLFFELIVEDFEAGECPEDLVATLRKSYEVTLEPYHGYVAQQLFGLLSKMVPKRKQIFQALTNGYEIEQEIVIKNIDVFCKRLKTNVTTIQAFYDKHDLENNYKV